MVDRDQHDGIANRRRHPPRCQQHGTGHALNQSRAGSSLQRIQSPSGSQTFDRGGVHQLQELNGPLDVGQSTPPSLR